ncbi:shikimate dehydrogenase [Marinobacter daqiaonensis]|uniref:Shikimate dehydrogenase (NADP(+)) n=1 Tax=Marinobacter daqiaonensis TaxID=650891 RepID=A0A1I6IGD1_9GAMM|nr:shikimate dehydrogenase [Marinobacter daqiaonensis]SFR65714.1 shikimate dehydrogenase [Marinobacter daqiaonensis]
MHNDLYAVVGNPVSHSKSPRIHGLFAAQTGEAMEYTAIQAPLEEFAETVRGFFAQGGKGLNVTVPFKEQAWELADVRSDRAQKAGAANTLYLDESGRLMADNTDGAGLVRDLTYNAGVSLRDRKILILGAGGAVRGVLGPILAEQPAEVTIANRTVVKAQGLVSLFADDAGNTSLGAAGFATVKGPFDIIVNGTSASLMGDLPPVPDTAISDRTVVYDMMYAASTTPFNKWAREQGAEKVLDGVGMLIEQAAESFRIWRGVSPDTKTVMQELRPPMA